MLENINRKHLKINESTRRFFPAKEVENFNDAFLALDQDNSGEMEAEGDYWLSYLDWHVKKFKVWEYGKITCLWGIVSIKCQYSFSFILIEAEQYRGVSIVSPHYFSAELAVVLQVLGLPGGVQEV